MSLEKVASGLGSIVKIIIYGFILLVIVAMFFAYKMMDKATTKTERPVEVVKNVNTISNEPKTKPETKPETNTNSEVKDSADNSPKIETPPPKQEPVKEPELKQVSVELLKMTPVRSDFSSGYSGANLKIQITNNTDNVIGGYMGDLTIKDGFGDTLMIIEDKYDKDLKPNKSIVVDRYIKLNPFIDRDQRLGAATKYKASFELKKVIEE